MSGTSQKTLYKRLRDMQVTMLNLWLLLLVPPHLLLLHGQAPVNSKCAAKSGQPVRLTLAAKT